MLRGEEEVVSPTGGPATPIGREFHDREVILPLNQRKKKKKVVKLKKGNIYIDIYTY